MGLEEVLIKDFGEVYHSGRSLPIQSCFFDNQLMEKLWVMHNETEGKYKVIPYREGIKKGLQYKKGFEKISRIDYFIQAFSNLVYAIVNVPSLFFHNCDTEYYLPKSYLKEFRLPVPREKETWWRKQLKTNEVRPMIKDGSYYLCAFNKYKETEKIIQEYVELTDEQNNLINKKSGKVCLEQVAEFISPKMLHLIELCDETPTYNYTLKLNHKKAKINLTVHTGEFNYEKCYDKIKIGENWGFHYKAAWLNVKRHLSDAFFYLKKTITG